MTAILSFLGGGVFRYILESLFGFLNKRQDHRHEQETMRLQMELARERATLQLEQTKVDGEIRLQLADLEALIAGVKAEAQATGVAWVDAYRALVRPTIAYALLLAYIWYRVTSGRGWGDEDQALVGVVFGYYFASRDLQKRALGA